MDTISIETLGDISAQTIHDAFKQAFADYVEPFSLSIQQLMYMLERRGCDLDISFGAFSNDKLAGFVLNGIGNWESKRTAYDTGTGVVKEFRKKRIATRIFNDSLPVLQSNGISQYLLEVIRTNTSAFELYRKAGFGVTREFEYFISHKTDIHFPETSPDTAYTIKKIEEPNWDKLKSFWDYNPSWQNSIDSITRKLPYFTILGAFDKEELLGYGIIENHTGDIPQLAVGKEHRLRGLGTTLLENLVKISESDEIKIINTLAGYKPFNEFARSINLNPGHGQYEMLLEF
jgi:ribosomal protein S18 acetylase RimI-like enzyme